MISRCSNWIKSNKIFVACLFVFLFAFSIRCFWIAKKEGIHVDEALTASIATFPVNNVFTKFQYSASYSGSMLKQVFFGKGTTLNQAYEELKQLRLDNGGDVVHPSLYYSLMRITTINAPMLDLPHLIKYGCGLNLIFFTFSFWIMYKLLERLFANKKLIPLGLFVAFVNTGAISTTLFIRPYELQMLAFVAVSYVFVICLQHILKKEKLFNKKNAIFFIFVGSLILLSGYFPILYVIILALILLYELIKNRQFESFIFIMFVAICSFLLVNIIDVSYFNFLQSNRYFEVSDTIESTNKLSLLFLSTIFIYINYFIYLPVVITLMACIPDLIKNKSKNDYVLNVLIGASLLVFCMINFVAPYKILRYVSPIIPIICIIIPYFVGFCSKLKQNILIVLLIVIYGICVIIPKTEISYDVKMKPNVEFEKFGWLTPKIQNVYQNYPKFWDITQNPEVPVVIVYDVTWRMYNFMYYFNDKQIYIFFDTRELHSDILKKLSYFDHYYLVFLTNNKILIPEDYIVLSYKQMWTFNSFEVERKKRIEKSKKIGYTKNSRTLKINMGT